MRTVMWERYRGRKEFFFFFFREMKFSGKGKKRKKEKEERAADASIDIFSHHQIEEESILII